MLIISSAVSIVSARAQGQAPLRRVLMLHAYNYTFPATTRAAKAARQRLIERSRNKIEIDADFLDLVRRSDPAHQARIAAYLAEKYSDKRPDVVMTLGSAALPFIIKYRDMIAPNVPVVFEQISPQNYAEWRPPSDMTGILSGFDFDKTLALAERLQPNTRRLYVVAGAARSDRLWQTLARSIVGSRKRKFETKYLFELPYNALLAELSRVPHDSIVILLSVFRDGAGKTLVPMEVAAEVARVSAAPVYAPYATFIDAGAVGGFVETFESTGRAAADMVLEILAGKEATTIRPRINPEQTYRVNDRSMQRWKLSETKLPPHTEVLFKEPSVWDQHRTLIVLALLILAIQTIVISALLFQRRRRQLAESRLGEAEERVTLAAAAANIGFWEFDPATDEFWATDHCRALLGMAIERPLTRQAFLAMVHPEDRELAMASIGGSRPAEGVAIHDIRVVLPDQQVRWLRVRNHCPADGRHAHRRTSGICLDVTSQREAEANAALQRQEVAHLMRVSVLGQLSGSIAHEINQPLTAILSNAQAALHMLRQKSPDLSELRNVLEDIVSDDNRASMVVHQLHDLMKKGERKPEPIDLNEVVTATLALFNNEFIARKFNVRTDLANVLPATSGNSIQIQQVLLNLIMNAMDAMTGTPIAQRNIFISTHTTRDGSVEVTVKDNGHGIRPDEQAQLFKPFYTTKDHGLGLGLTICSTIAQAHGGNLTLKNADNGGAIASFSLPAEQMLVAAQ